MTETAVILELRHVRLAEQAMLRPASLYPASSDDAAGEEGVFVALDDPPPVRTVLAVVEGERRRALEVAWVVEVAEHDDAPRGFYGRWVGDEALERAVRVGTEHLEDGTPVVQPVVLDHSSFINVSDAPVMAMPAPVMIVDDESGVVDDDDEDREEADEPSDASDELTAASDERSEAAEPVLEAHEDHAQADLAETVEAGAAQDDATDTPSKARKKRGRKRR
jgi:hypothetical protein